MPQVQIRRTAIGLNFININGSSVLMP